MGTKAQELRGKIGYVGKNSERNSLGFINSLDSVLERKGKLGDLLFFLFPSNKRVHR